MNNKLVSIITPMYNAEATIAQTIESVLAQTYEQWELLLVDDCSTDGCTKIAASYAQKEKRIRYCRLESNQGVANARNTAIAMAQGRFLAFLDSDDIWRKDKLQKQLEFMEKTGAVFTYTACAVIDKQGKYAGKIRYVPEHTDYRKLLKGNVIPCLTVLLDRQSVRAFRMPAVRHEDYAFWLSILQSGTEAYGLNEVLAEYRIQNSSISRNKLKAAFWTWNIYYKYQRLGFFRSCYYFMHYMLHALLKRI